MLNEVKIEHWEQKHSISEKDRVSSSHKLCYGIGGLSEFLIRNTVQALAIPIFAVGMGLDPFILGLVMATTKIISVLADPIVGVISDNTRSRWGRRKPFLMAGAVVTGILCPFVFRVQDGNQAFQFGYVFATLSIYFIAQSFYSVPYLALGFELTDDYDERTNIFAWKNYICMAGVFVGIWAYWFTLRPIFGNEMNGAQVFGAIMGIIIIIGALFVIRGTQEIKERHIIKKDKMPLIQAIKTTITNRSFLLIQGAILVVALGIGVDATIGMYLHVHYTCQGDKNFASFIGGVGGTVATATIFFALAFATWYSRRAGKKGAAMMGMTILLLSSCLIPWFLNPTFPWLVVIIWIMNQFGTQCTNLMSESMIADICDEDELKTGERREGSYAAAKNALYKAMEILILITSGFLPRLAGYIDTSVPPTMVQLERMKVWLYSTDILGIAVAIILLWFYPLTRKRCAEIRKQLDKKQRTVSNE